jgi:ferredoxin
MNVKIEQDTCIGCGSCTSVCPNLFDLNDEGKAYFKGSENPSEIQTEEGCAKEAADICPVEAIIVMDEE